VKGIPVIPTTRTACILYVFLTAGNRQLACRNDLKEETTRQAEFRARILKLLRITGIDSKESIPPAYVESGGPVQCAIILFLLGSKPPQFI
jgi:hypothetical protein